MKRLGLTVLTAAIGGVIALGGYKLTEPKKFVSFESEQQKVNYVKVSDRSALVSSSGMPDFVQPAAMSTPAVVHITTTYRASKGGDDMSDAFGDLFGVPQQRGASKAFGSGVIISPEGYIVTNNHVIEDANNIQVVLENKKSYKAKLIGTDPNTDIALLKIDGTNLPILKFGNSDDVRVGEWVLAVGNPFNLTSTVTAGIVSAKGRSIGILGNSGQHQYGSQQKPQVSRAVESFIQTDAAVNRGNSGGALVNLNGELVGINSAIASGSGNYEGYSFAVPVNLVKKVVDDLRNYGSVQRGYLGITMSGEDMTAEFVKDKKLNDPDIRGVYVQGVEANSSAMIAGIKPGDIITRIQGVSINSNSELQEQVARYRPGDNVNVAVLREGSEKSFKLVLKNMDGSTNLIKKETASTENSPASLSVVPLTKQELAKIGVPFGVKIAKIENGVLKDSGLKPGFIVLKINDQEIKSNEDIEDALGSSQEGISVEYIDPREPNVIQSFQRSSRN